MKHSVRILIVFFQSGLNEGMFIVESISVEIPFSVFLLDQTSRLVITDIDGTITESDVKGFVFPQLGIEAHQVCLSLSL